MITARAPDLHIERFCQTNDLSGIRPQSVTSDNEMPRALHAKFALTLTE
ncbi:hypothetical protein ANTHELSMS3_02164 [Antarctobacter heliothermus]|uniref:Uncharacterized protein n=1 Tax=Antarctobacter heliothermus TaxID=74033 RepID=A0A222E3V6_9RHOB|nr:hypothetical protein ANTHELSMS3_02164 [Antarctobacter heliothermus]